MALRPCQEAGNFVISCFARCLLPNSCFAIRFTCDPQRPSRTYERRQWQQQDYDDEKDGIAYPRMSRTHQLAAAYIIERPFIRPC